MGAISLQRRTPGSVAARDGASAGADSGAPAASAPPVQQAHPPILRVEMGRLTEPGGGCQGPPCCFYSINLVKSEVDIRETNHREMPNSPQSRRRAGTPLGLGTSVSRAGTAGAEASGQRPCHCLWAPMSRQGSAESLGPTCMKQGSLGSPALTAGCGHFRRPGLPG